MMDPRISLIDKLKLKLRGYLYLEDRLQPDWKGPLQIYLFKCPIHGHVESYPHGHDKKLVCPQCRERLALKQGEKAYMDLLLMDEVNEAIRAHEKIKIVKAPACSAH